MIQRRLIPATLLALLLGVAQSGWGADQPGDDEAESRLALWEMRLAAFGRYGASYPASDETQLDVIPLPLPIYRGRFWRIGEDQVSPIRGRILRRDRVKLDIAFDLTFPVDSDDVDVRRGMPDLDLLLELGPELEIELATQDMLPGRTFFGLQLRPAFSFDGLSPDYEGVIFNPELMWRLRYNDERDEFKVRLTPAFASKGYMEYFYEVKPQFATPTRPAFSPDSGYLGTDLTLTFIREINKSFEFIVGANAGFHHGAANDDSPLFVDKTNYSVYAAFTWKFWESERRASDDDDTFF